MVSRQKPSNDEGGRHWSPLSAFSGFATNLQLRRQTGCQPAHGTVPFTRMFRIKARNGNTSRSSVLYDCFRISNAALCAFTGAWTDNNRSHTNMFNRLGVHALLNVFTMFSVQRPDATCSTRTLPASDPYFFFSFFPHQMADCGFLFPFPT